MREQCKTGATPNNTSGSGRSSNGTWATSSALHRVSSSMPSTGRYAGGTATAVDIAAAAAAAHTDATTVTASSSADTHVTATVRMAGVRTRLPRGGGDLETVRRREGKETKQQNDTKRSRRNRDTMRECQRRLRRTADTSVRRTEEKTALKATQRQKDKNTDSLQRHSKKHKNAAKLKRSEKKFKHSLTQTSLQTINAAKQCRKVSKPHRKPHGVEKQVSDSPGAPSRTRAIPPIL